MVQGVPGVAVFYLGRCSYVLLVDDFFVIVRADLLGGGGVVANCEGIVVLYFLLVRTVLVPRFRLKVCEGDGRVVGHVEFSFYVDEGGAWRGAGCSRCPSRGLLFVRFGRYPWGHRRRLNQAGRRY